MKYQIDEIYQDGSESCIEFADWPSALKWIETAWENELLVSFQVKMIER